MSSSIKSAAVWSVARTAVRLACGFISIKVTAVYLGPAGLALVGQLNNFIGLTQSVLMGGVDTAVVKMGAELEKSHPERAAAVVGTALRMAVGAGTVVAALILLLHVPLSRWLLGDPRYALVLALLALVFPLGMLARLQLASFTARRRFDLVSSAGMLTIVLGAVVFITAAWRSGIWGGLLATAGTVPVGYLVGYWLGRREAATRLLTAWPHASRELVRPILRFYPMLLANSVSVPLATILIRGTLMESLGESQAGLWQATLRLSDMYTMVFLTALGMYSLPTLSGARGQDEFASALRRMVLLCIGSMAVVVLGLYLGRDLLIRILFTEEFAPVRDLWPWRLAGDLFFIAGWPMRSALVARERRSAYIAVEVAVGLGSWAMTVALLGSYGLVAANIAYALAWAAVFVWLTVLHRRELFAVR